MTSGVLDISEVSKRSGLPASALRYYEEIGLIRSVGRKGLRRLFDGNVLETLAFIALGQRAGFPLDGIAEMLSEDGRHVVHKDKLLAKADELDREIKQLSAVRDGLRHAAECKAPTHLECATFQRFLTLALKSQARGKGRDRAGPGKRTGRSVHRAAEE